MENRKSSGKQIIAIILLVVGLVSAVFGILSLVGGSTKKDPYEVRNSVVLIESCSLLSDGSTVGGAGTGFAIGKPGEKVEYIVTNGHVVQGGYKVPTMAEYQGLVTASYTRVYYSAAENDFVVPEVIYYSAPEQKDIAILKLPSATDKREPVTIRSSDSVQPGEHVSALGYPALTSQYSSYMTFDQDDITFTQGNVTRKTRTTGSNYNSLQMNGITNHGNSGGPIVDDDGSLVGICVSGVENVETGIPLDVSYAIESDELIKILDDEKIEYSMSGSGLSWLPSWTAFVFLPIGLLGLAGGIILMIISGKEAQGVAAGVAVARGMDGSLGKKAVLRGVTGKYSGQSFDLMKSKVVIGRDPAKCNIVFEKDTAGISGVHCQVAYDANEDCFVIKDLGSSYGTFLGNGKKLTPNVPEKMSAGDTFYLCDNANRFVVSKE